MYLRKRSIIQLYYILIPVFFLIFMVQTTSSFADTLIKGKVLDKHGVAIDGIKITAFNENDDMLTSDYSDESGDYELNMTDWFGTESFKDFYVRSIDESGIYIPECYNEVLYAGFYDFKAHSELIHLQSGTTKIIDFHLWKWGTISANLNVPDDRGYKLSLTGTINFKNTPSISHSPEDIILLSLPSDKLAHFIFLPPGGYTAKIEDINLTNYPESACSITPYYYETTNVFFSQYHDHESLEGDADTINLADGNTVSITFSNLPEAGMIYGLITDPEMEEINCYQFNQKPHTDPDAIGSYPVYVSEDDEIEFYNNPNAIIEFYHNPNAIKIEDIAIHTNYLKIIPWNSQEVIAPIIPSKLLRDPNFVYHISVSPEKEIFGGYAFKYLDPWGDYKIQLFHRRENGDIISFYYKDATSITHLENDAGIINLSSGEKIKRVDICLQKKVFIHGNVREKDQNGDDQGPIQCRVDLLDENRKMVGWFMTDPNNDSYFSFEEFIFGNNYIRIAEGGYNVINIPLSNVQLGDEIDRGIIYLEPYEPCPDDANNVIHGRVFLDEDPNVGIKNIEVRASDIEHIYDKLDCLITTTNDNGEFIITNLPDSKFIVYIRDDPDIDLIYKEEMHNNIIMSKESDKITDMLQTLYDDPTSTQDPNIIIAELIDFKAEENVRTVNFGLSTYEYHSSKGLNLFAYPGNQCDGDSIASLILPKKSLQKFISLEPSPEGNKTWRVEAYQGSDPNSVIYRDIDYRFEAGHGYLLYLNNDLDDITLLPSRIVPTTLNLDKGPNLISMPEVFEKGICSPDVINNFNFNTESECREENASSINHFNSQSGKWKSTTSLWGLSAGDNFKIKRQQGYMVYMKKEIPSWKSPNEWHN